MTRWLPLLALMACTSDALDGDTGWAPIPGVDTDGDGLSDAQEELGWTLLIDFAAFGIQSPDFLSRREVTSDPFVADSDRDGLSDSEEFFAKSDPGVEDTDVDGLTDWEEVHLFGTSPSSVDTDGDSRGPDANDPLPPDARLFDLGELDLDPVTGMPSALALSPLHADTDGDGVDDLTELRDGGRDPRIAELPVMQTELVDPLSVRVRVDFSEADGTVQRFGSSYDNTSGTSDTRVKIDTRGEHLAVSQKVETDITIGIPPGIHIKTTTTVEFGESGSVSNTTSEGSFDAFSSAATQARAGIERVGTSNARGEMSVGVRLSNPSLLTYEARDLGMVVRQYFYEEDRFRTVALLQPPAGFDSFSMPSGASTPVIPFTVDVAASEALALMENPTTVFIEPASYALTGADGRDYGFIAEESFFRTALVTVNNGVDEPERTRVASGLRLEGEPRPANLIEVLERLGHSVETRVQDSSGRSLLYALDGRAVEVHVGQAPDLGDPTYPPGLGPGLRKARKFWAVLGNRPGSELPMEGDFADIEMLPRDQVTLLWTQDIDRDGLSDREEALHGARDSAIHSDGWPGDPTGDDLSDWFEVRVGWEVAAWTPRGLEVEHAYPSPMVRDSDGDGWDDGFEYEMGTHPLRADTDGDSIIDSEDEQPLVFVNGAPEIDVAVMQVLNTFTIAGGVTDPEGNLAQVSINWGDGTGQNIFDDFDSFGWSHTYATSGDFTITITARDTQDLTASQQLQVTSLIVPTDTVWEQLFDGSRSAPPAGACLTFDEWGNPLLAPPRTWDSQYAGACLQSRCGYDDTGDSCYNSGQSSENEFDDYNNWGPSTNAVDLEGSFTLTGWVRRGERNWGTGFVVGEMGYPAIYGNGPFRFTNRLSNGAFLTVSTTETLPAEEWWFIAGVVRNLGGSSEATLYWQPLGQPMRSAAGTAAGVEPGAEGCTLSAGAYNDREWWNIPEQCSMDDAAGDSPQRYFDGYVDDVRVFNRALSLEEIEALGALR